MIRPARMTDMNAICALLLEGHGRSASSTVSVNIDQARKMLARFIVHRGVFSWVSDGLGAALFGGLERPWYSQDLIASDYFCYSKDGNGANLLRRFIGWAIEMGARQVVLEQSSGIDIDRAARLYDRIGLQRVGSVHVRTLR